MLLWNISNYFICLFDTSGNVFEQFWETIDSIVFRHGEWQDNFYVETCWNAFSLQFHSGMEKKIWAMDKDAFIGWHFTGRGFYTWCNLAKLLIIKSCIQEVEECLGEPCNTRPIWIFYLSTILLPAFLQTIRKYFIGIVT